MDSSAPDSLTDENDAALLAAFAASRDDDAFRELVRRHTGMVLATARRTAGDQSLAEEVTQGVFLLLAQKAPKLQATETLGPWLHRCAVLKAMAARRKEIRARKVQAVLANGEPEASADSPSTWEEALPLLDEAVHSLPEADRRLVVMRFYERTGFRDAGLALGGKNADAVRMQLQRALEKLGAWFRRRGVAVSLTALAAGMAQLSPAKASPALLEGCCRMALVPRPAPPGRPRLVNRWLAAGGGALFLSGSAGGYFLPVGQAVPEQKAAAVSPSARPVRSALPVATADADTPLRQLLSRLAVLEDEDQHPEMLAEAILLTARLKPEDFPLVWEEMLKRAGREFKYGRLPRPLCRFFVARWAEVAPAEAFAASQKMPDGQSSMMVAFDSWQHGDAAAARAALESVVQDWNTDLTMTAWKRLAKSDPAWCMEKALPITTQQKFGCIPGFHAWRRFMESHGLVLNLPGEPPGYDDFEDMGASVPGLNDILKGMEGWEKLNAAALAGSMVWLEGLHRMGREEEVSTGLDSLLSRLSSAPGERDALRRQVNGNSLLSAELRAQVLNHSALLQP